MGKKIKAEDLVVAQQFAHAVVDLILDKSAYSFDIPGVEECSEEIDDSKIIQKKISLMY